MRKIIFFLIILLFMAKSAYAGEFSHAGYIKSEVSVGWRTHQVSKAKEIIQLSGEYKINDYFTVFASGKYWYDFAYSWYGKLDPAGHQMRHIQRNDWLRDAYVDYNNGPWFLRLGKQQVAWGQADGIPVLDRVNPFDLTEYWLPDMRDIRIPLWMANINYSPKLNSNLQILIIPDFEQSTAAPPTAPFAFRSYKLFNNFKQSFEAAPNSPNKFPFGALGTNYVGRLNTNIYYPAKKAENSKIGVQWQDRIWDWEYTLNYIYGYDYLARTYLDGTRVRIPPFPARVTMDYSRRFKIVQIAGGSVNHTFTKEGFLEGITFRGDAAVYINEPTYYGSVERGNSAGTNRWNNIMWIMGLDRYFFTKWLFSFQFGQYIMEHESTGVVDPATGAPYETLSTYTYGKQDKCENIFSLRVASHFINNKLIPELLWSFTDDNQGKVSPKISYEIMDNLVVALGMHYFYGDQKDTNGEFIKESQVYTNVKFSF